MAINENAKKVLTDLVGQKNISIDKEILSARQDVGLAEFEIRPGSAEEVGKALEILNQHKQSAVIFAGNTGLVSAGLPQEGEVLLNLGRLNNMVTLNLADGRKVEFSDQRGKSRETQIAAWRADIDAAKKKMELSKENFLDATVSVEAAVAVDTVNAVLRDVGIEYPMDMGSNAAATLGACTANCSAGARAVRNGTGGDMTVEAEGYRVSGEFVKSVNPSPGKKEAGPGELAINSAKFSFGDSLIGSQGTLGVITKTTVTTSPLPKSHEVALFAVDNLSEGVKIVESAKAFFTEEGEEVELAELIDQPSLQLAASEKAEIPFDNPAAGKKPFFIMVQVRADTEQSAEDLQERFAEFVMQHDEDMENVFYDSRGNAISHARHSITHGSDARLGQMRQQDPDAGRVAPDVAVPLDKVDTFAGAWRSRVETEFPDLEVNFFGHLGVGGFHIHHRGNMAGDVEQRLEAAMAETVQKHGGTYSAEHGVGVKWAELFAQETPPAELAAIVDLFAQHDPHAILNPRSHQKAKLLERLHSQGPAAFTDRVGGDPENGTGSPSP